MIDITSALWRFWEQFTLDGAPVPAYQADAVPDDAAYPYITFEAPQGEAFGRLPLVARLWCRYELENNAAAIAQRMAIGEAIAKAIPPLVGHKLPLSVGFLMLYRGSGDFLYPMQDAGDKNVIGLRIGYEVTYYTT